MPSDNNTWFGNLPVDEHGHKLVSASEMRRELGPMIDRIRITKQTVIVTKHGKSVVALVPAEMIDGLQNKKSHGEHAGPTTSICDTNKIIDRLIEALQELKE